MRKFTAFFLILFAWTSIAGATVSDSTSRVQYSCNGSLTDFDFTFGVTETADIAVVLTDSDDTESTLTETSEYSISCTNDDCTSGGTVTTVDTYVSGNTLTILRAIDLTQESDFVENQPALYDTFETALDKLTYIAQQQQEEIDRSLKYNKTLGDSPGDEIGGSVSDLLDMYLGFDGTGNFTLKEAPALSVNEDAAFSVNILAGLEAYTGDSTTLFVEGRTVAGDGYQGYFQYVLGDYSSECTADTAYKGVFVPKSGVATTIGCWIRKDYLDNPRVAVANWFMSNTTPGTTDMTDGIQAAENFFSDLNIVGTVKLLAETYLTDEIVFHAFGIESKGVNLEGAGMWETTILMGTAAGPVIRKEIAVSRFFNAHIGGFTIKANASSNPANTDHIGIFNGGWTSSLFHDIRYESNGSGNLYALFKLSAYPYHCYDNHYDNIFIEGQSGPAVPIWSTTNSAPWLGQANIEHLSHIHILNNSGMTTAIDATGSTIMYIESFFIEGNTTSQGVKLGNFTILQNGWFENNLPANDLVFDPSYSNGNTLIHCYGLNSPSVPSGVNFVRFINCSGDAITGDGGYVVVNANDALSLEHGAPYRPVFGGDVGTDKAILFLRNTTAAANGNKSAIAFQLYNDYDSGTYAPAYIWAETVDKTGRDTKLGFATNKGTGPPVDVFIIDENGYGLFQDAIGVGNTVANTNTPSGATAYAMPIRDEDGNLLGYIPVYAAQW